MSKPAEGWQKWLARFVARGGGWVIIQLVLMVAVLALGPMGREGVRWWAAAFLGWVLVIAGAGFGVAGVLEFDCNRTIFPRPKEHSHLVQRRVYRIVRHPLYTSAILLAAAWAMLWESSAAMAVAGVLAVFLDFKARREERWLREEFPDYAAYQRRVKRLIPWVY
jgi:protein-S-isoprenylcysteine O-methyltransferase Ste14